VIDHISLKVKDFARSKAFYEKALAPLGFKAMMSFPEAAGYGDTHPAFWIGGGKSAADSAEPVHVAFAAKDRKAVDAFHQAALAAGGKDNGKPGLRPQNHKDYYGAFVYDPDGNNVEAVCHKPL
jgi:catechol 2,3-dioxygenase-like lactoylglutathione lyase family enzyme